MGLECILSIFRSVFHVQDSRLWGADRESCSKSWRQVEAMAEDVIAGAIELRMPVVCSPRLLAALLRSWMLMTI